MSKLEQSIAALATLSPAQLRAAWRRTCGSTPPALSPDLLRRGIAYRMQEKVKGGLPAPTMRELDRLAAQLARNGEIDLGTEVRLRPGTRLMRNWHGETHVVLVTETGYLFQDRAYASLTQIASDITGTHWSGPRFFGLRKRRSKKQERGDHAAG